MKSFLFFVILLQRFPKYSFGIIHQRGLALRTRRHLLFYPVHMQYIALLSMFPCTEKQTLNLLPQILLTTEAQRLKKQNKKTPRHDHIIET